jgi:hypothetical protein
MAEPTAVSDRIERVRDELKRTYDLAGRAGATAEVRGRIDHHSAVLWQIELQARDAEESAAKQPPPEPHSEWVRGPTRIVGVGRLQVEIQSKWAPNQVRYEYLGHGESIELDANETARIVRTPVGLEFGPGEPTIDFGQLYRDALRALVVANLLGLSPFIQVQQAVDALVPGDADPAEKQNVLLAEQRARAPRSA